MNSLKALEMNMQVKETLLQKCEEVEQTARDQATDNAILDQLRKMVEIDIPQSLFEEQGRQFYGAQLLQIQFPTEDLVKEVENSIAEFKRHKQEYDEERVQDQVQEMLEGAKVLEWLRKRAEIQYIPDKREKGSPLQQERTYHAGAGENIPYCRGTAE